MPSGTTINKVFAPRLHITNAERRRDEAIESMDHIQATLIWLAARSPIENAMEQTIAAIDNLLAEYASDVLISAYASEIINYPQNCVDELNPQPTKP
tara:strand:- start:1157 stop:1447 length:291 start_codon:yes stop_codon:yes gene_type:complete